MIHICNLFTASGDRWETNIVHFTPTDHSIKMSKPRIEKRERAIVIEA